jgi:23S rRNA (cytosine1962-C5)-methyltransferase
MEIRPTPFGHLGLFPEQVTNWQWIESRIGESGRSLSLLNLFAYTGGATLCAARAGASVCHVDASRGVVSWARLNTAASGLTDRPVRWIIEDVTKFLSREERRGRTYDALVLDPPSFGRGAKGEVFKIERDLVRTLELAMAILAQPPRFILLTCHSPGMTPLVLRNLLEPFTSRYGGSTEASEMVVHDRGGRPLPSGSAVRWSAP